MPDTALQLQIDAARIRAEKAEADNAALRAELHLRAMPGVGDGPCCRCGGNNPAVWFVRPSENWNRVMGGPDATDDPGGSLCPNCFFFLAHAAGIDKAWAVTPEEITAIDAVIIERQRQDAKWGGPQHDDRHDALDWREFIRYQLDAIPYESNKAQDDEEYDGVVRQRFVKIAALAVAAIESQDRLATRERELVKLLEGGNE